MADLPATSEALYEQAAAAFRRADDAYTAASWRLETAQEELGDAQDQLTAATRALAVHEVTPGIPRWRQEAVPGAV